MSQIPNTPDSTESTPAGDTPRVALRRTLFSSRTPLDVSRYAIQDSYDRRVGYFGEFPASMDITPVGAPSYPEGDCLAGARLQAKILSTQGFMMKRQDRDEELSEIYGPCYDFELQRISGHDFDICEAATVLASIGITLTAPVPAAA